MTGLMRVVSPNTAIHIGDAVTVRYIERREGNKAVLVIDAPSKMKIRVENEPQKLRGQVAVYRPGGN